MHILLCLIITNIHTIIVEQIVFPALSLSNKDLYQIPKGPVSSNIDFEIENWSLVWFSNDNSPNVSSKFNNL